MPVLQEEAGLTSPCPVPQSSISPFLGKGNLPVWQDQGEPWELLAGSPMALPQPPSNSPHQKKKKWNPPAWGCEHPKEPGHPWGSAVGQNGQTEQMAQPFPSWLVLWISAWHGSDFQKALLPSGNVSSSYRDWQRWETFNTQQIHCEDVSLSKAQLPEEGDPIPGHSAHRGQSWVLCYPQTNWRARLCSGWTGATVWPQSSGQGWPQAPHTRGWASLGLLGKNRVVTAQGGCSGPFRPFRALRAGSSSLLRWSLTSVSVQN